MRLSRGLKHDLGDLPEVQLGVFRKYNTILFFYAFPFFTLLYYFSLPFLRTPFVVIRRLFYRSFQVKVGTMREVALLVLLLGQILRCLFLVVKQESLESGM